MQHHLQHYTEPTAEPIPATASSIQGTTLPLGPGTLTHNSAGVSIIVACTKADLIDDNNDIAGTGASGMGGMVKGKGSEWEEQTDGIMQVLRVVCLKCKWNNLYSSLMVVFNTLRLKMVLLSSIQVKTLLLYNISGNMHCICSSYLQHHLE